MILLLAIACGPGGGETGVVDTDTAEPTPPADLVLWVEQETWDGVPLGCTFVSVAAVRNEGAVAHEIAEIAVGGTAFTLTVPTLPYTLAPGEELAVPMAWSPVAVESVTDTLTVVTDAGTLTAPLAANAVSSGTTTDTFTAAPLRPVDVVVTLDQSESMYNDPYVVDELASLCDAMDAVGLDWRLAIIGVDGCVPGGDPVDPADVGDYPDDVADMVDPLAAELGFTQLEAMVGGLDGCNAELLRDDAALAVVGVTDEIEQSPAGWEHYVELLAGLVPEHHLTVHAVAGDYPAGCDTAQPGLGWYEASVATGGVFLSVCDDVYAEPLAAGIVAGARAADGFRLSEWPVDGAITVTVDGVAVTTWAYDAVRNAIVFEAGTEPAAGAAVRVDYEIQGLCED